MAQKTGSNTKAVNDEHANRVKNWLKHADQPYLTYDEEREACQYITRAIISYYMIFNKFGKTHYEFNAYLKENFPDLELHLPNPEQAEASKANGLP